MVTPERPSAAGCWWRFAQAERQRRLAIVRQLHVSVSHFTLTPCASSSAVAAQFGRQRVLRIPETALRTCDSASRATRSTSLISLRARRGRDR
jgi:hypothetical protein